MAFLLEVAEAKKDSMFMDKSVQPTIDFIV